MTVEVTVTGHHTKTWCKHRYEEAAGPDEESEGRLVCKDCLKWMPLDYLYPKEDQHG